MIEKTQQIEMLRKMVLIREFENAVSEYKDKKYIYGSTHCYNGEEAVAVGVCSALNKDDYIVSNHRPHGHAIAKGMDPNTIMAEIFGKKDGSNLGKGGSMHIQDSSVGLIMSSGIVGSGIPLGCGAAYAAKRERKGRIACVFFGDGSANEGILHECLNLASAWNLPILFALEDNGLAITTSTRKSSACNDYVLLSAAYGIEGQHVDGQDVEAVYHASIEATNRIRAQSRPFLLQLHTIRFNEHAEGAYYKRMIEKEYRDYSQLEKDKKEKCPIRLFTSRLLEKGIMSKKEVDEIQEWAEETTRASVAFATASPEPDLKQAIIDVFRGD